MIPTLKVDMPMTADLELIKSIIRFCTKNYEGCGWVVKMPNTDNGNAMKICPTIDAVFRALDIFSRKYDGMIHYAMIQPCMSNRKEYKVVLHNGKAKYIASIRRFANLPGSRAFSEFPHLDLFSFAENARVIEEV